MRLITATRFSISNRDEFKRSREYPLLVVSGSVSRGAWIHCVSGDWQILYHKARSHRRIERERGLPYTILLCGLRGRGRVRSIARGSAEDRVPHLSIHTEQMVKFNTKPNELFANENHASAKQTSAGLRRYLRPRDELSVPFLFFPSLSFLSREYNANVNLRNGTY